MTFVISVITHAENFTMDYLSDGVSLQKNILMMNRLTSLIILSLISFTASAQTKSKETISTQPDPSQKIMTVEAACGECQLGLSGKGCDLAIRMNGHAYFVDGTNINSHGDAHGADGFCEAISKAEVQGKVVNGRFKATYFKVIKEEEQLKEAK